MVKNHPFLSQQFSKKEKRFEDSFAVFSDPKTMASQ